MNREDVVAVGVRLFAVFLLVLSLRYGVAVVGQLARGEDWPFWLVAMIVASEMAMWVLAAVLWFFPLTVARKLLPAVRRDESHVVEPTVWDEIALSLMGVWLIASALWSASYWLVFAIAMRSAEFAGKVSLSTEQFADMGATVVELVTGLYLAVGARGLAALLRRLRGRARYVSEDSLLDERRASASPDAAAAEPRLD